MARLKYYDYNQTKMTPLRLADQIQPGTFEYTLNHVVDNDLNLSLFEQCYRNNGTARLRIAVVACLSSLIVMSPSY